MSAIFALVAMAAILLVGAAAIGTAADSGPNSALMTDLESIFQAFLEPATALPLLLTVGLVLAALGVFAR